MGGQDLQSRHYCLADDRGRTAAGISKEIVNSARPGERVDPETLGGVGLLIEVDQERPSSTEREGSSQVLGGGGLTDAALMDDHGQLAGHYPIPPAPLGVQ